LPFGVDLLLPQVGGRARTTNKTLSEDDLDKLLNVIITEKASLFVSAVGIPPRWAVDKLHKAGIPVMNMCGLPRHVTKALDVGVDIVCVQGTEAGGHTGDVATLVLVPQCVDLVRGKRNFFGTQIPVVAAGGIYDGRGLAAAISLGASGVWIGTRFVASTEASTPKHHKDLVINTESDGTIRTLVLSGRPLRVVKTPYIMGWETKPEVQKELLSKGIIPIEEDMKNGKADMKMWAEARLVGQACGGIKEVKGAKEIVEEIMRDAVAVIRQNSGLVARL